MCHVATSCCSHALSHTTLSHSYSLVIPTCFSLSLLIFQPHPPVIINTTPSMSLCLVDADATSRSPPVTHAFTYNICSPVFTHTHICRSHLRDVSHTSFCARRTWAGIQPNAPHSHSFKTFLTMFCVSVLNVMQSKEEKTGLGRFQLMLSCACVVFSAYYFLWLFSLLHSHFHSPTIFDYPVIPPVVLIF